VMVFAFLPICRHYPDTLGYGKHFEAIVRAWRPTTEASEREERL
jgi:hypothetical protein